MDGSDEQTRLLQNIWSEMKALNARSDRTRVELGERIDEVGRRINQTREELSARIDQTREELVQTREELVQTREELSARIDQLGGRIDNVLVGEDGRSHATLEQRVGRIEQHLGLPAI